MIRQFQTSPCHINIPFISFFQFPPTSLLNFNSRFSFTMTPTHGLILFFILANAFHCNEASLVREANGSSVAEVEGGQLSPMLLAMEAGKMEMMMVMNESRRKLGSFQICALCTCCGGAKGVCLPSPCCYAINCNIPNRPFGFCSFTPKTCNCFGCHL